VTDSSDDAKVPINSLPDQYRWGVSRLPELLSPLIGLGLKSIILFGVVEDSNKKDEIGSYATNPKSPIPRALKLLKQLYPTLLIIVDICLCAYTNHGHCGITFSDKKNINENNNSTENEKNEKNEKHETHKNCSSHHHNLCASSSEIVSSSRFCGFINNSASIRRLSELSIYYGECGADVVAPSDMMDGRIGSIKSSLLYRNLSSRVSLMSYSVKMSSCFYGPFRDAAGSGAKYGDRAAYQFPIYNRGLALRAIKRDIEEGADFIMVKPGAAYLDLIRDCSQNSTVPTAVYQVSGEYAMIWHGAQNKAFGLKEAVFEQIIAFKRAGAGIILTYFTPLLLQWLKENQQSDAENAKQQEKHANELLEKIKQSKELQSN